VINWNSIDTVLLDMDGTLLDLEYDNVLWNEQLPIRFAARHGITIEAARAALEREFANTRHSLEHYCLDYWARFTALDLLSLHRDLESLIRYRGHAVAFLERLRSSGRRVLLVTNAHRHGLAIKDAATGLTGRVDQAVSSHDYRAPKEADAFWRQLDADHPFDRARTLLIDDNSRVLDAARMHGIAHLLTVTQPDSSRPPRECLDYAAFNTFDEVMPP
jgi:HAD superfamily hydrolase (TIGR01509 family)